MPGDGQASDTARLNDDSIDNSNHHGDDLSDEATAEARFGAETRLRQEAAQMRVPPAYTRSIRDVTADFVAASQQLPPGELVKDEFFTLFEAVGALEIMDPKMDSGYIEDGDSFEPDFDVTAGRELEEVLWIMDELLCLEMNFHAGYPLSQNVFTSLHVFRLIDPETKYPYYLARDEGAMGVEAHLEKDEESIRTGLVHVVLEAYCVSLVKCVALALEAIQGQTYYEEEDFVTYLFGRELLPYLTPEDSRKRLIEANNWIHERKTNLGEGRAAVLQSRIKNRIDMLLAMTAVEGYGHVKQGVMNFHGHDLARPVPEAFSHKVQRQLATSTPPRPQPTITWSEACELWSQMCDDLQVVEHVLLSDLRQNPQSLLREVWAFGYRDPHPSTFARAKMQEILILNEPVAQSTSTPHHDLLLRDIRELVLPGFDTADPASFEVELTSSPRHKTAEIMNSFMTMVYTAWLDLYLIACQNRCRMRRSYANELITWSKLLEEAPQYDQKLNKIRSHGFIRGDDGNRKHFKPLTHWTRYQYTQLKRWVIQLGFDTEIYLPDEYLGMYQLFRTTIMPEGDEGISPIERLHGKLLEDLRILGQRDLVGSPKDVQQLMAWRRQCSDSVSYVEVLVLFQRVENTMASAIGWMLSMLEHMKIVKPPNQSEAEARLRQEARLKPLIAGSARDEAAMLRADEAAQTWRRPGGIPINEKYIIRVTGVIEANKKTILDMIAKLTKLAKEAKAVGTEYAWLDELDLLKRTTFDMGINTLRVLQICQGHGGLDFEEGKDYGEFIELTILPPEHRQHAWWVVPQISEKKKEKS